MEEKYTTLYSSKKYYPGAIFESARCGQFRVLGRVCGNSRRYYIEFELTNFSVSVDVANIPKGKVNDPLFPVVYGVGYLGVGEFSRTNRKKAYTTWYGMLQRTHTDMYAAYKNTTVDSRWHNFQTFCADIECIEGYSNWIHGENFQLDKDIIDKDANTYSKDTCTFISKIDNLLEINKYRNSVFLATRLADGYTEEGVIQREFCRKYGLTSGNVSLCLQGVRKQHKGWSFKWLVKDGRKLWN